MGHDTALESIGIVLCRVEGSINVGSACRAMKSMGITRLVLADCPEYDDIEVRTHSLLAYDVYAAASRFDTLSEALSTFSRAAGFTRRVGQRRKENKLVEAFAASLSGLGGVPVALVFGNERDGLSDAELSSCDESVCISSSDLFPSLNLSHAVQIACWEVRKALSAITLSAIAKPRRASVPALRPVSEASAGRMADALSGAGLYKIAGKPEAEVFLRSVVARAALSETELLRLETLFVKLAALAHPRLDRGGGR